MKPITICGTGHRPKSLPDGYLPATFARLVHTAGIWLDMNPVAEVISGMALGWDQALARAAIDRGIPVAAYIPFIGQADSWPTASHYVYQELLAKCATRKVIRHGVYSPKMMQIRNEAMVDDSELVLALWNGEKGGTGNCVNYALDVGKPVENLWDLYSL